MIEHMYSGCDCRVGQIRFLVVFARVVGVRPCVCVLFIYVCTCWRGCTWDSNIALATADVSEISTLRWLQRMYLSL